jgi:hypothetical protein
MTYFSGDKMKENYRGGTWKGQEEYYKHVQNLTRKIMGKIIPET